MFLEYVFVLHNLLSLFQLQISAQCSELYCDSCWQRLHDTLQSIQLFRVANEFWNRHLKTQNEGTKYDVNAAHTEEIKIEPLYIGQESGYKVEYFTEDALFVEEPITWVDNITKPENVTAKTNEDFIDNDIAKETVNLKLMKTANNKECIQEFPCGKCDKGMYMLIMLQRSTTSQNRL